MDEWLDVLLFVLKKRNAIKFCELNLFIENCGDSSVQHALQTTNHSKGGWWVLPLSLYITFLWQVMYHYLL
jgi:hypothetical protein